MNTLNFVDVYDFVSTIPYIHNNILDKNDGDDISIIAKYDEANEIIKALINIEDYELTSIVDFINPSIELEDTAYNDEYIQQSFQAILSKREYDALRSNSFGGI